MIKVSGLDSRHWLKFSVECRDLNLHSGHLHSDIFKTVATNMKKLLFKEVNSLFGGKYQKAEISSWVHKSVGTIHTFQGKESEVVILLLGGNPQKPGSLNWAAKEPNILNVGLTRAKNLIFVVGNHKSWSKRKYFQDLSFEISRVDG